MNWFDLSLYFFHLFCTILKKNKARWDKKELQDDDVYQTNEYSSLRNKQHKKNRFLFSLEHSHHQHYVQAFKMDILAHFSLQNQGRMDIYTCIAVKWQGTRHLRFTIEIFPMISTAIVSQ